MICHLCQDDPCTCATEPLADANDTPRAFKPAPTYDYKGAMTKEQFGLVLFEAIKTNAARLQAEKLGKLDKAKELLTQLTPLLSQIEDREAVTRILEMR